MLWWNLHIRDLIIKRWVNLGCLIPFNCGCHRWGCVYTCMHFKYIDITCLIYIYIYMYIYILCICRILLYMYVPLASSNMFCKVAKRVNRDVLQIISRSRSIYDFVWIKLKGMFSICMERCFPERYAACSGVICFCWQ